jgi:tripartite ATP-independent transporter DctP family solute receptor
MCKSFWRHALVLTMLGCGAAQGQTALRAWSIHPEGYPVTVAMRSFAEEVGKTTQGKYRIEVFSSGVLGDQPKAVQMIKSGEMDIAELSAGPLSDVVPGLKAFNLPFLFTDSAHMFRHLDGKLGDQLAERLKAAGFVVMGWYDGGSRSFYCANKPITSAADLMGQTIRVQQSEIYIEMVKLLGAKPLVVPYKDVQDSLQQKKIDCAENNMPSFESAGHYKVAKYVYLTNHVISPEALVVSTKLWSQLNDAEKAAFKKAGQSSALLMRDLWNKRVAASRDIVAKDGVQFFPLKDPAPFIRRMAPLYAKYMSDPTTRGELLSIVAN